MLGKIKTIFILLLVVVTTSSFVHNYYVGICTIDYNKESESLEVSLKLTAHDVEAAIESVYNEKLRIGSKNQHKDADEMLFKYIDKHFDIACNGEGKPLTYVGMEVDLDETLWVYVEVKNVKEITTIRITNSVLCAHFPGQQNIVHLNVGDVQKSLTLNSKITTKETTIK